MLVPLLTFSFYYSSARGETFACYSCRVSFDVLFEFSFILALFYALFLRSFAYRARFVFCAYT